jgi:quinol monooxygenase YgiN
MAHFDILVMTMISARKGMAAPAVAAVEGLLDWMSGQPGLVWVDVLADPKNDHVFWLAERWKSRDLRDGARLDPAGTQRLQKLESLLDQDDVATYVPVDIYPHHARPDRESPGAAVRTADASPLAARPPATAPTVIIARFHLRPGSYDRFMAAERRHDDSLDGTGVIGLEIARHADNPNRICHYEIWRTPDSHAAYADSFERQRFLSDAGPLLLEPEPSEELRLLARFVSNNAAEPGHGELLVPPVDRATLSPEARKAIESAPPVAFFDTIGHAQVALRPQIDLMLALMANNIALKQRHRMLATLLVLVSGEVTYEWNRQLEPAPAAGVTQAEIDAIVTGWRGSPLFEDQDRLVLGATAEVLALGRIVPATFAKLVRDLGAPSAIELLLNVGHFRSMGQIILSTQLPAEPSPDKADDRSRA